jgi:hypothetical protein
MTLRSRCTFPTPRHEKRLRENAVAWRRYGMLSETWRLRGTWRQMEL